MPLNDDDELYADFLIELYKNPKNFGKPKSYDKSSNSINASCGDYFTIYLKIDENGKVRKDIHSSI